MRLFWVSFLRFHDMSEKQKVAKLRQKKFHERQL